MASNCGYIYIFVKNESKDFSILGCSSDWEKDLNSLNLDSSEPYHCYAYLKVKSVNIGNTFFSEIINVINPNLEFVSHDGMYKIAPNKAYEILMYLSSFGQIEEDLHLLDYSYRPDDEETTSSKDEANSDDVDNIEADVENSEQSETEVSDTVSEMGKNECELWAAQNGYKINGRFTYASKNSTKDYYWANPKTNVLYSDWTIILNDIPKKKIYVFEVPAMSIRWTQMGLRDDNSMHDSLQIEIKYDDPDFTDMGSKDPKVKFKRFLKGELSYPLDHVVYDNLKQKLKDVDIDEETEEKEEEIEEEIDKSNAVSDTVETEQNESDESTITRTVRDKEPIDFDKYVPTKLIFKTYEYPVHSVSELLLKLGEICMNNNLPKMIELAEGNYSPVGDRTCITERSYMLRKPLKIESSEKAIFIEGDLSGAEFHVLLKSLTLEMRLSQSSFAYEARLK